MTSSKRKYAYTLRVVETVESECVIESDRKLTMAALSKRAEKMSRDGKLDRNAGVPYVRSWLKDAETGGVKFGVMSEILLAGGL